MILRGMQELLARLYDVDVSYDVYDFLTTDPSFVAGLDRGAEHRELDEQLLLAETADGAGMSLYLEKALLARLELDDPIGALSESNLADYCTALEGVSHFMYAAWRIGSGAPMSLLELETQAEVDKYAATVFLLADQRGGEFPAEVHARLFESASFDPHLAPNQRQRYETASRCAARFCRSLERRFVSRGAPRVEALVRELRRFYRLGAGAKMRHGFAAA
jgi:hypothetical protein